MNTQEDWFVNWFDSHYYHLLYKDRGFSEAEHFISRLFKFLDLKTSSKVLDLACGKGRHARQVNELGYEVLGVDLSEESIKYASKFSNESLHFKIADMRSLQLNAEFDLVLNLFTSFGYFQKEGDNVKAIESMSDALKTGGLLVLDFLNVKKVKTQLPVRQVIQRDLIEFHIHKKIEQNFIVKNINFSTNGQEYSFKEFVKLIDLEMFRSYFEEKGLEILELFGSYDLEEFKEEESDRLILIARKK